MEQKVDGIFSKNIQNGAFSFLQQNEDKKFEDVENLIQKKVKTIIIFNKKIFYIK